MILDDQYLTEQYKQAASIAKEVMKIGKGTHFDVALGKLIGETRYTIMQYYCSTKLPTSFYNTMKNLLGPHGKFYAQMLWAQKQFIKK